MARALTDTLIPPLGSDARKRLLFDLRLAVVACAGFIGVYLVGIPALLGAYPWLYSGAMTRDQGAQLVHQIDQVKSEEHRDWASTNAAMDEQSAVALRVTECKMKSGAAKDILTRDIDLSVQDYEAKTGRQMLLPACGDL